MFAILIVAIVVVGMTSILNAVVWIGTHVDPKNEDFMARVVAVMHWPALICAVVALALELAK